VKIYRSDYDTRRANIFKLEDKYTSRQNINKLSNNPGSVSKSEVKKIEREAVLDVNRNVDLQQELLNDIGRDLTSAHSNMNVIVSDVKGQTDTIYRIKDGLIETDTSQKRTDKNINAMLRRNFCQKCLLHILAVVLFLAILASIFYKVFK
jgi:hypothetical protein